MGLEGKPLALLVNPSSGGGRGKALLPRVREAMDRRGLDYRAEMTRDAAHAINLARSAVEAGEVPVVMSGDGLIGLIGGALALGDTPMGILPGGRGNDLARVLGIPSAPEEAVANLCDGEVRRVDVGEANGKRFLCIASVGFDSDANRIANETTIVRGNLVYAYAALRALAAWKPAEFTVAVAGEEAPRRFKGYTVAAANSKAYGGGMFMAPTAELDDGLLEIITVGEVGKLRFLANLPKVFKGTHVTNPEVTVTRGAEVEISADRAFAVYADGEHITDLPAKLRVLPAALGIVAPR